MKDSFSWLAAFAWSKWMDNCCTANPGTTTAAENGNSLGGIG